MSITFEPPAGPWTVEDLERLPDLGYRFEIHEGNLVMMSPVRVWHTRVARRIAAALGSTGRVADMEITIKRTKTSSRIADVAIFKAEPDLDQSVFAPDQIETVIEIVSESSVVEDRIEKPRWYAASGIPEYWCVEHGDDPDPGAAVIYRYKLARTAEGKAAYIEDEVCTLKSLEERSA